MFSAERLKIARSRRKLSGKALAELSGLTSVTISKAENGHQPDDETVRKIADALNFPYCFFFMDKPAVLEASAVSFRSLKKMSAAERDASLAAGAIGISFYEWIENKFNLPQTDLIDLSKERDRPDVAARLLRQHWGIGDRPIGNILKLFESKGIRILSLSENTPNVDAYSFWHSDNPYIFLNQYKTPERSNFDAAHELAHLVLHFHAGSETAPLVDAEKQADQFASAFLMPEADIKSRLYNIYSSSQIIASKKRWKVSAMALATRLYSLNMLTEWNYRSILIDLGKKGYRKSEPNGVERESSVVISKVLTELWRRRINKQVIAQEINVPWEEIEMLVFDLAGSSPGKPTKSSFDLVEAH